MTGFFCILWRMLWHLHLYPQQNRMNQIFSSQNASCYGNSAYPLRPSVRAAIGPSPSSALCAGIQQQMLIRIDLYR